MLIDPLFVLVALIVFTLHCVLMFVVIRHMKKSLACLSTDLEAYNIILRSIDVSIDTGMAKAVSDVKDLRESKTK